MLIRLGGGVGAPPVRGEVILWIGDRPGGANQIGGGGIKWGFGLL